MRFIIPKIYSIIVTKYLSEGGKMLNYAENIKKIRKRKNYTQSELAKDIASQGMISKIEKRQLSPDIDLLEAIADKLDCSLMDLLSDNNESELNQVYSYIDDFVSRREYQLLEHFFENDSMIKTIKEENESYYKWISGIILSQNKKRYEDGIAEMVHALNVSLNDQLTTRILVGLSGLYSETGQFEESLECLLEASTLSENVTLDIKLKQTINFQLARVYSVMEKFDQSIFYNRLAIQFAVEQDSLYLLDDLYLLLADSYLRINQINKAKANITLANTIAELRGNTQLIPYIELTQNQITEN